MFLIPPSSLSCPVLRKKICKSGTETKDSPPEGLYRSWEQRAGIPMPKDGVATGNRTATWKALAVGDFGHLSCLGIL